MCCLPSSFIQVEFSVYLFVCFVISFPSPCDHVCGGADVLQLCCREMKLCRRRLQVFGLFFETCMVPQGVPACTRRFLSCVRIR